MRTLRKLGQSERSVHLAEMRNGVSYPKYRATTAAARGAVRARGTRRTLQIRFFIKKIRQPPECVRAGHVQPVGWECGGSATVAVPWSVITSQMAARAPLPRRLQQIPAAYSPADAPPPSLLPRRRPPPPRSPLE